MGRDPPVLTAASRPTVSFKADAAEGPVGPAEDSDGGTRGGRLRGCRHQFSASSSFPLATRGSERLPIGVPLQVADRAGRRRSDRRVARGKLLLAENWYRQPDGGAHSHKMAVPSALSPAEVAGTQQGQARPRPQAGPASLCACLRSPPVPAAPQLPRAGPRHRQASEGGCPAAQGWRKAQVTRASRGLRAAGSGSSRVVMGRCLPLIARLPPAPEGSWTVRSTAELPPGGSDCSTCLPLESPVPSAHQMPRAGPRRRQALGPPEAQMSFRTTFRTKPQWRGPRQRQPQQQVGAEAEARGRERDRELEISMREKHRSAASCTLPTGDVPATKREAARPCTRDGGGQGLASSCWSPWRSGRRQALRTRSRRRAGPGVFPMVAVAIGKTPGPAHTEQAEEQGLSPGNREDARPCTRRRQRSRARRLPDGR
ncbi:hypothetical protein QTO34_019553 [Cnephaeus nilssonii]|uniref:Uncharacterized protein n=1 Tax=Cnephaeus nilssonii TaxID=3371016 RepID=A0AA40HXN9_CNENI|nr:hypothetical protein QTO34_019553 [Eptesicus nilssonii]